MTDHYNEDDIELVLDSCAALLARARDRNRNRRLWSAYKAVRKLRQNLYWVESELAHGSPKAAMDWGCAIRVNGKAGIDVFGDG